MAERLGRKRARGLPDKTLAEEKIFGGQPSCDLKKPGWPWAVVVVLTGYGLPARTPGGAVTRSTGGRLSLVDGRSRPEVRPSRSLGLRTARDAAAGADSMGETAPIAVIVPFRTIPAVARGNGFRAHEIEGSYAEH